jgi:pimeloyl-ACP methyl ester carboxylesterase
MPTDSPRRERLIAALAEITLVQAYQQPDLRADLEAEAADSTVPDELKIIRPSGLEVLRQAATPPPAGARMALFFSNQLVALVPGFLGSLLRNTVTGRTHWVSPLGVLTDRLSALQLAAFDPNQPDHDKLDGVAIEAKRNLETMYGLLNGFLEVKQCDVREFPVDWRKDLEAASIRFRDFLTALMAEKKQLPIHVVAHSQGAMVARRGLQLLRDSLGEEAVLSRVKNLILLGPANRGSFSAASVMAGVHTFLDKAAKVFVTPPPEGLKAIMQSMTGVYQLLPWDANRIPNLGEDAHNISRASFWSSLGIDEGRLAKHYGWAKKIDTDFFAERTTTILGDAPTAAGVTFVDGTMMVSHVSSGDGTVPDPNAWIDGATHVRLADSDHMLLPTYPSVIGAVNRVIHGEDVGLAPVDRDEALKPPRLLPTPISFQDFDATPPTPLGMAATKGTRKRKLDEQAAAAATATASIEVARAPTVSPPAVRRLRIFGFDPSLSTMLNTRQLNRMTLAVPWEANPATGESLVAPGPVGEYVEVIDHDPSSKRFYQPVDLNHPHLLAQDGLTPSEADPQFHQQMVYAVAMNTIGTFEYALGRQVVWSKRLVRDAQGKVQRGEYVPRLRIYPHALREANAYYSPDKKALLFGYFHVGKDESREAGVPPDGTIFTCLSQEVVAHETTHAVLDGLHRYFTYDSNPDVSAFHEAFADIVALFQHFSHPEVVRDQVAKARGDLRTDNLLGKLAVQFGKATGNRGALREYIGDFDSSGVWKPYVPQPDDYQKTTEPHARGAILVAAVFDAFLSIYEHRIKDLMRIGRRLEAVQPDWQLHPDLVGRLADEAAKSAGHVLQMCVRAVDYLAPIDVTFGDYLRAVVTADHALVPDDDRGYRVSLIDAFRRRGLFAYGARSLSEDALRWQGPAEDFQLSTQQMKVLSELRSVVSLARRDRKQIVEDRDADAAELHGHVLKFPPQFDAVMGINRGPNAPLSIPRNATGPIFEVHSVRAARRVGPDGQELPELFFEVTQARYGYRDANVQKQVDAGTLAPPPPDFRFRGGATLVVDLAAGRIRYSITKDVNSNSRLEAERKHRQTTGGFGFAEHPEPFAMLHRDLASVSAATFVVRA